LESWLAVECLESCTRSLGRGMRCREIMHLEIGRTVPLSVIGSNGQEDRRVRCK
jgi:hypothetical protein